MVDEFGAHHARFAGDDELCPVGGDAVGCCITNEIHFSMMASNLDTSSRGDAHGVAKAFFATAKASSTTWAAIIAVHEDHVSFRINQQGAKGTARAVGCLG